MINLVRNELSKIFHKKFIYIILGISLLFVVLTNVIYNISLDKMFYNSNDQYIEILKSENEKNELKSDDDISWFVSNQTEIDVFEIEQKYGHDSWQTILVREKIYDTIYQINMLKYGKIKDEKQLKKLTEEYDKILLRFANSDWRAFVNEDLNLFNKRLEELKRQLKDASGINEVNSIKREIDTTELSAEICKIRLNENIPFGNDYLNDALSTYENNYLIIKENDEKELTDQDVALVQDAEKYVAISKYIIDTKEDINNSKTSRMVYINFFNEYSIFILVIVIVIAGTIVSEEYHKGTIKLLLTKPHSRFKILLSKYISSLIMLLFGVAVLFLFQTIVGLIAFDSSSLSVPVVEYDFASMSIIKLNVFKYVALIFLTKLPMLILLMSLAFALSTIIGNSAISIIVTLLGNTFASVINMLTINYDVEILKYWVTLNWDFEQFLFHQIPEFKYLTINHSIIVCLVYFLILTGLSILVFKKKNIKNI